jgi:hypothetical protein
MKTKFTREELYNLVWSTPLSVLSKKYDISDNGLRKICIRMNIPLPKNGHWQKIKNGKRPHKIELTDDHNGDQEVTLVAITDVTPKTISFTEKVKSLQKVIEIELQGKLIVPEKLLRPDSLITAFNDRFKGRSSSSYLHRDELNISVSAKNLSRALKFLDALIKVIRLRNHSIAFSRKTTAVVIRGEKIEIRLNEKNRAIKIEKNGWTTTEYEPTGILYFAIKASYSDKIWEDGKTLIEGQLSNIIAYMEVKGEELHQRTLQWESERKIREEKARKLEESIKQQDEELQKFKILLGEVDRWNMLKKLRAYINGFEKYHQENDRLTPEIEEKINWMKRKADWYDPRINLEDELFVDLNKDTLQFRRSESAFW